jgi:hypothetical protein
MLDIRLTTAFVAAFAAALAATPAIAAANSGGACATRGTTVAANSKVRVFGIRHKAPENLVVRYFGCTYGHQPRALTTAGRDDRGGSITRTVFGVQLNGGLVTFGNEKCSGATVCPVKYRTVDLRTGKAIRKYDAVVYGGLGKLVAAPDGSFAASYNGGGGGIPSHGVIVAAGPGGRKVLDEETPSNPGAIDVDSLAIAAPSVYWIKDGAVKRAKLP